MVSVQRDVAVPMRDGVVLRADVYRPAESGRYPVLLRRTCYDKSLLEIGNPYPLAERGYIVVIQDVRGRHGSAGDWPWGLAEESQAQEAEDGFDTIEWAAQLAGSDGRVATWGHSFDAWSQWRAAELRPPALAAMSASGMPTRLLDWTHGIFETGRRLQWAYSQAVDIKRRASDRPAATDAEMANRMWQAMERGKWIWHLPLDDLPRHVLGPFTDELRQYFRIVQRELFDLDRVHPRVDVPVLLFTGWWDRLIRTVDHYSGLTKNGPEQARDKHRLVIGPWGHSPADLSGRIGSLDHGAAAGSSHEELVGRFFDHHLKGIDNGLDEEPPVRIFVLGRNEWRFEHEWPLARAEPTPLFLHGAGGANTVWGDGELSAAEPGAEPPDRYTYDPADPVMSLMAPNSQAAPMDQAPLDDREDVLVYQSAELADPIEVTGPITAVIWAISDAPDTDWTVKLVDVHPDGQAINVSSGIVRARYRAGFDSPLLLDPGTPVEYEIEMTPISIVFGKGHRIRLDVSSSDFPNFDRNHNTGAPFYSDRELRPAHQQVLHDNEHRSRLLLPLVRQ